jgi:hypothetical protein
VADGAQRVFASAMKIQADRPEIRRIVHSPISRIAAVDGCGWSHLID